jgi:4-hydroxy-2-oxoheptanedioate aldolase
MARINRAIDKLARGETIYYTEAGDLNYDNGRRQAATWADYLIVEFEHAPFDVVGLAAFMRGLVDGGPTPDGYRTPTVIATLPANCRTPEEMHANAWQARQVLAAGVHGILHTHARRADAVRAFVEACRYPFATHGRADGLGEGQRGSGGQERAAAIWGVTQHDYLRLADPWPLNPDGELLLGVKIEDRWCLENADEVARVPGIAFAEWGPGDMGMSFGYPEAHDPPYPPELEEARTRVKAACDAAGLHFLSSWNDRSRSAEENARFLLGWGVTIIAGNEELARAGRRIAGEARA